MTSKRKKVKDLQRQNNKKNNHKKQSTKIISEHKNDFDPSIYIGLQDDLSSVTSQEKGTFKNNKHHFLRNTKISHNSQKPPTKRSKDFFVNCYAKPKKTKNPKNSLTQNLNPNVIPIASNQKTNKSKDSLTQSSRKKPLKKSSKHKPRGTGPLRTILS